MIEKRLLPPLKNHSKQGSPSKVSSLDLGKNVLGKKPTLLLNRSEEIHSKLRELNDRFYAKVSELNRDIEIMEGVDSHAEPESFSLEKPANVSKDSPNFCDVKLNASSKFFHNEWALVGAKYPRTQKEDRFSRKKCRDLREILRFSMKPQKSQVLNPERYLDFIRRFEEYDKDLERIEKLNEFREKEKAHMEKLNANRKRIIRNLVINQEKADNCKSSSVSPSLKSPSKHSRNSSLSNSKVFYSPGKSLVPSLHSLPPKRP